MSQRLQACLRIEIIYRPEGLISYTWYFKKTFGTFYTFAKKSI